MLCKVSQRKGALIMHRFRTTSLKIFETQLMKSPYPSVLLGVCFCTHDHQLFLQCLLVIKQDFPSVMPHFSNFGSEK